MFVPASPIQDKGFLMGAPIDEERLRQLVEAGLSNAEIGRRLGIEGHSTIARHMARLGLVSRYQSPCRKAILPDGFREVVE